jgi:hypothetical protein
MSSELHDAKKELDKNEESERSDFFRLFSEIFSKVDWIIVFILFVVGLVLFSVPFIDEVLSKINGAVDDDCPTNKGTIIQLSSLIGIYVLSDILHKYKVI